MSEAELHWLHQRLQGGKVTKAEQGHLRFRLPSGLVDDPVGRVVFDPDEAIQEAIRLVFTLFEHTNSARAVVSHFAKHPLLFPTRPWGGAHAGEVEWVRRCHGRVLDVLHRPLYAGAYVSGRTQTRRHALPGEEPRIKGHTRRVKQEDWPIVLLDHHPGSISWEQWCRNQQQLADTQQTAAAVSRGAVREGPSLLQGMVLCGLCGRRMTVRSQRVGSLLIYECSQAHTQFALKTCQTLRGERIDQAVSAGVLEALVPAQGDMALATLDHLEGHARRIDQQARRQIEHAQDEADLACRRSRAVDPDNRLVARSLEREWNEQWLEVDRLERDEQLLPKPAALTLSIGQREQIRSLAQDVPARWESPTPTKAQRKQRLRWLITDVTLAKRGDLIMIDSRWQTEACTSVSLPRLKTSWERRQTPPEVIACIRQWAPTQTDASVARRLNEAGYHAGGGGVFTAKRVQSLRSDSQIEAGCPQGPAACPTGQRGDGRDSARTAAALLNVTVSTIAKWCEAGLLASVQAVPHGPRWISLTPERIAELRKPTQQHWKQRHTGKPQQRVGKENGKGWAGIAGLPH